MNNIIVAGTGTAAYLTVAYMEKFTECNITWYKPNSPNIGVGEGTTPSVPVFLRKLGFTERNIINVLNGSPKTGVVFKDFKYIGHEYIHPFGNDEDEVAGNMRLIKKNHILKDFSNNQAVHMDVEKIAIILDGFFERYTRIKIINDFLDPDMKVPDNTLIIDCTGFDRHIVKHADNYEFISCEHLIPNNRALVFRHPYTKDDQRTTYSTMHAKSRGWIWEIPLGDRVGTGYVHNKEDDVREEFEEFIQECFGDVDTSSIRSIDIMNGRNNQSIYTRRNHYIAAIGLSDRFVEPMEATGLMLVHRGIERLADWVNGKIDAATLTELQNNVFDDTVNFIIAHYNNNEREEDYWLHYRGIAYTIRDNNSWDPLRWKIIQDGFTNSQDYVIMNDKNKIKFVIGSTPWETYQMDLSKYVINQDLYYEIQAG